MLKRTNANDARRTKRIQMPFWEKRKPRSLRINACAQPDKDFLSSSIYSTASNYSVMSRLIQAFFAHVRHEGPFSWVDQQMHVHNGTQFCSL